MAERKIIFIEFDGGSWGVMEPLLRQGKLPNIQKLLSRGASGTLLSDSPMFSPRLWVSIFTGKRAEKHGVHFFGATSRTVQCKRIWDIFSEKGLRVGVFGTLVTWPPHPVNGFIIPSIFALGPETFPEDYSAFQEFIMKQRGAVTEDRTRGSLARFVQSALKLRSYGIGTDTLWYGLKNILRGKMRGKGYLDVYWRKAIIHLRLSLDTFIHLYKEFKPHFATFHIHLCDAVSHRYWAFFEPEKFPEADEEDVRKYGRVIPTAYREADWAIGRIVSLADEETTLVVASDHGSAALPHISNPWLVNVETLSRILGIEKTSLPARFGLDTFLYSQDSKELETVAEKLSAFTLEGTAQKVFVTECHSKYIIVRISKRVQRARIDNTALVDMGQFGTVRFSELFYRPQMRVSGSHHIEGILIMAGPHIAQGASLTDPTIFDLTPTMLALMGCPVAEDMDGQVLTEGFTHDFFKRNMTEYVESYERVADGKKTTIDEVINYDKMKKRLGDLGYL